MQMPSKTIFVSFLVFFFLMNGGKIELKKYVKALIKLRSHICIEKKNKETNNNKQL